MIYTGKRVLLLGVARLLPCELGRRRRAGSLSARLLLLLRPWFPMGQVLHPARAQELQALLAQPQSRTGLNEALTSLKERLDAAGLSYQDLSGALPQSSYTGAYMYRPCSREFRYRFDWKRAWPNIHLEILSGRACSCRAPKEFVWCAFQADAQGLFC